MVAMHTALAEESSYKSCREVARIWFCGS